MPGSPQTILFGIKYNPKQIKDILHIDEKKNLRIDDLDLSMPELVNEILSSQIIDNEEKAYFYMKQQTILEIILLMLL